MTTEQIRVLIDTDLIAAFDEMDKLNWGNQRGVYLDLKRSWIDPPQGSSRRDFRERFKILLSTIRLENNEAPIADPQNQNLKAIQKEAKERIIRGTDVAIKFLEEKLKDGEARNNLSLLKAEWQEYRKEEMLGLMDFSQKQLRGNGLRYKVMTLIDDLNEEDLI